MTKIISLSILAVAIAILSSCSPKVTVITNWKSDKIPVDARYDSLVDQSYISYLAPFKAQMDAQLGSVIGMSAQYMRVHKPESLLSNLISDIYRAKASELMGEQVDIAVVNMGGIRSDLPEGEITTKKVFELIPFENELVVLWLKGDLLMELLHDIARVGGQGVSGLQMEIINGKASNVYVGSQSIDGSKTYKIATNDYLAAGNDGMVQLQKADKMLTTGLKVRDMILQYIKNETSAGRLVQSTLDGRIRPLSN